MSVTITDSLSEVSVSLPVPLWENAGSHFRFVSHPTGMLIDELMGG